MSRKVVFLQGVKFRDTLILSLKGTNKDLFKQVGGYNVIMFPAIVDDKQVATAEIDEPFFHATRIDQLMMSPATVRVEGGKEDGRFFNKKPIPAKELEKLMDILNKWEVSEYLMS